MNDDLVNYLTTLGKLALFVRIFTDEQGRQAQTGILQDEEMMHAETIEWAAGKLLDIIDAQVAFVSARTPEKWEEIITKIIKQLKEENQDGKDCK